MGIPAGLHLTVEDSPTSEDVELLPRALEAFNKSRWPHQPWQPLAVFVRDQGTIAAGLAGHTYAGWLFVQYLWVSEGLRRQGIGRELMAQAERRAMERGCHSAALDTFGFQVPGFYRKLGYEIFGTLDYPPKQKRFFLQKHFAGKN